MILREAARLVRRALARSPAVALIGPRQCGKTTLARSLDAHYYDLEQEPDRLRLDLDWEERTPGSRLIVLDEAQTWPEVFPRLRGEIDRDRRRNGRFLLLGSVSPSLMREVSESLSGRLALVELTPLLLSEIGSESLAHHWLVGGFPDGGILDRARFPVWQTDYLSLLTQRDLPQWGLPAQPQVTLRLLRMLAASHGQPLNFSRLAQSLGLTAPTVSSYVDHLEGAFLLRRLVPFLPNIRKRSVKTPRCFFRDSGLLHALLGVHDRDSLLNAPWVGASFEGYVIEQVLDVLAQSERPTNAYFFRTSDQWEIDLLLERGNELWAIEVKLTTRPGTRDFSRLEQAAALVSAGRRILVSMVSEPTVTTDRISCNLPWLLEHLRDER